MKSDCGVTAIDREYLQLNMMSITSLSLGWCAFGIALYRSFFSRDIILNCLFVTFCGKNMILKCILIKKLSYLSARSPTDQSFWGINKKTSIF
jgi:hypothetical protein